MSERLCVGLSTCPNDTFAFHGLVERRVDLHGFEFEFVFGDVEELNARLARGDLAVSKGSFAAGLGLARDLCVLPVGAALGFGVGPVLLARPGAPRAKDGKLAGRVLAPGAGTTANLLYRGFHPDEGRVEQTVFSAILPALERGEADYGACIHEARFTWREHALEFVEDLGATWERATQLPLPLGGILARKDLGAARLARVSSALRDSLEYGAAHRDEALTTMRAHAQELDDAVLWKHVELYVNAETFALSPEGARALERLAEFARRASWLADDAPELEIAHTRAIARLFRIATREDVDDLRGGKFTAFDARALAPDGFVHLSFADQVVGTLERHYASPERAWLLEVDRQRARAQLRLEPSRGGALFPHLYRGFEAGDIVGGWPLVRGRDGWSLPSLAAAARFDPVAARALTAL
ncbi:MAG: DUF952 domain-containing protein [Planctomycetes bacterium]|nr:DUF952 domain-containing protein [Planctomycetota bacterium]